MLYKNESPLKDPSEIREDADRWRHVTIQALKAMHMRMMASGVPRQMPSGSPTAYPRTHASPPAEDLHRPPPMLEHRPFSHDMPYGASSYHTKAIPVFRARADSNPPAQTASSPPASQRPQPPRQSSQGIEARDEPWGRDSRQQESHRPSAQHAPSPDSNPSSAATWGSEEVSDSLPDRPRGISLANATRSPHDVSLAVEPSNPPFLSHRSTTDSPRDSVATVRTNSSGNSIDIQPIQSESRRPSSLLERISSPRRHSSRQQGTIEHTVGEINSNASSRNDWHGFCRGTFEISEDHSNGLELVQRPFNLHSTKVYLQCKRCAFPGFQTGQNIKKKMPDTTVMVSARGIRYRWMFLAKSHVKSTESRRGVIDVAEQTKKNAYRCNFCYLEGTLPDKLGGIETLMNHIWQHHRRKDMSPRVLKRTGCIIGRVAESYEAFDINIPSFEQESSDEGFVREPGDVIFAGTADLAAQAIGLGVKSDNGSDSIPGVYVGVTELGPGRRGSPIELPGDQTYLTGRLNGE